MLVLPLQRSERPCDLARVYEVEPRVLNQAVKRNQDRFPEDFAFRLTRTEAELVSRSRSHSVILKRGQHLAARLATLEKRVGAHDRELRDIILAIRAMIQPPDRPSRKRIGFG